MKHAQFEQQFDSLSSSLIRYVPGDLMMISGIMDSVNELSNLSPLPEYTETVFSCIIFLCRQEIQGHGTNDFSALTSQGLDLMHAVFTDAPHALKMRLPLQDHLVQAINEFIALIGTIPEPTIESELHPTEAIATPPTEHEVAEKEDRLESHQRQIMATFLQDARERLDIAQARVLDLETSGESAAILNELFRVFHTFKGETGFLHLPKLGEIAHHFESILDHLRNQRVALDTSIIDLLLEGIDVSRAILDQLVATPGQEGENPRAVELVERITGLLHQKNEPVGKLLARSGLLEPHQVSHVLQKQRESGFLRKFGEIAVAEGFARPEEIEATIRIERSSKLKTTNDKSTDSVTAPVAPVSSSSNDPTDTLIKVKASQIEFLVDMLGELVISLNQLDDEDRRVQASRKIAKNLQLSAMQVGTVSIGSLFSNLRRIVRETCRQVGREADLIVTGEDLEVDRKVVDKLSEPLMHLLRNAIGHGIETAEQRIAAGKPARGVIHLIAERKGHHVVVRVRDDGQGLHDEHILNKAIEKGLVTREKAAGMSRSEILDLIFVPGFSTAEVIDAVSGRGVGMDVVKNMVELMRGKVSLESVVGEYTEVILTFPINMAIIDGMIVQLGGRLFVIPVSNIVESMELVDANFLTVSEGVRVCNLRGETMPVIDLGDWFGLKRPVESTRMMAVVVEARGSKFLLEVHDIVAKREVVIKSLGRLFALTRGISSGTILQGGRIGLVLDIDQIVRLD